MSWRRRLHTTTRTPSNNSMGVLAVGGAEAIASTAAAMDADVIVVAADGGNAVSRLFMGSLLPGLITAATVPVLVCPKGEAAPRARRRSAR